MSKNFIWGILLFVLDIFIIFQNYIKNFGIPNSFFIDANETMAFIIGVLYANQYRKFDFKHILSIFNNSIVFAILTCFMFSIYGNKVNIKYFTLTTIFIFICLFVGYGLFYLFFCPKTRKYKFPHKNFKYFTKQL